jgi:trk system potassium uptake protein TrkA
VDDIISPTRMALAAIEQDIPVHELLHLAQLPGGRLELIEARITEDSPALGRRASDLSLPEACSLFAIIRGGNAQPIRSDTALEVGDTVLAISRTESENQLHDALIGAAEGGDTD